MENECYLCRGIVSPSEHGHFRLGEHTSHDHDVYLHERCAAGYEFIDAGDAPVVGVEIECPVCGEVETRERDRVRPLR